VLDSLLCKKEEGKLTTEEELVKELKAKALRVIKLETHDVPGTKDKYTFYTVYWLEGEVVRSEATCIHVDGETGNAYWKDRVPTILAPPAIAFRDKVKAELKTFLDTHPEIETVNITSVNEEGKNAILQAFCEVGTESEEKRILVYEKAGEMKFKLLK